MGCADMAQCVRSSCLVGRGLKRRSFLYQSAAITLAIGVPPIKSLCAPSEADEAFAGEILGQGEFRYRAYPSWGALDPERHPVRDCHGICVDRRGRIVMLTNDTHNNLIAYHKRGTLDAAWESRFQGAHGLDIVNHDGEEQYWITDSVRNVVSVCTSSGNERRLIGPEAIGSQYPGRDNYHPTNSAVLESGEFFVSDGYGSSFVLRFDPSGGYMSSFGGEGDSPENLKRPHAVWIDRRSGKPVLLVCDRDHDMLKWFSLTGELVRTLHLPGASPCNVAALSGRRSNYLAVASLNGMILILDPSDSVVSAVGAMPPIYVDGQLQYLRPNNKVLTHPHDVCVDSAGALYVAQWNSGRTYPIKLEPL